MRDGYGRTLKKRRSVPNQYRAYRHEKEEKMTEEERIRASNNFERRLRQMDAERLRKFRLSQDRLGFRCSGGDGWVLRFLLSSIARGKYERQDH